MRINRNAYSDNLKMFLLRRYDFSTIVKRIVLIFGKHRKRQILRLF